MILFKGNSWWIGLDIVQRTKYEEGLDIVERKYYEWMIGYCSRQIVGGEEGIFFKGNSKMRGLDIVQRKKYVVRIGYCSK